MYIKLFLLLLSFFGNSRSNPVSLFPFGGPGSTDLTLPRDADDVSSPEFKLSTPITFFGQSYPSLYINQNGLISFSTEIPVFVNIPFPLDYPSIAPFYSDVDTRGVGTIYYREEKGEEQLNKAGSMISTYFKSGQAFRPSSLVVVTWEGCGYFDKKTDKTNTFQLMIASDGQDSYAGFLYERIEWIRGTGKNPNLQDAKAQAGFISGNGRYFALKESGSDQMSNLHKTSNTKEDGLWIFRIGQIGDQITEPDLNIEQVGDSTSEATSSCMAAPTFCHSFAQCIDYQPGFCCKCIPSYYGNGRVCLQTGIPQRLNGRLTGNVNGITIEESEIFSYILPSDGRAYTAIAKIPERLGFDLQTVSVIGTIIGWMFSTSVKDAPNGFQITGGVFNFTAEISFTQTGQKVTVQQSYTGLDVFNQIKVDTRVHGSTPVVPVGKQIEVNDFEMQFTRASPGILRSSSSHKYVVEDTSMENPFTIDQTVEYNECPWSSPIPAEIGETIKMRIGRNYIYYDPAQQIVRFAITSKVSPLDGEDPCKENKDKCPTHSSCVSDDDEYKCICDLGYEHRYIYEGDQATESPECTDIDECRLGISACDVKATCINSPGSYYCSCPEGFEGNGQSCAKVLTCTDVQCGANAICNEVRPGEPSCSCQLGYYGDGLFCYEHTGQDLIVPGSAPDCRQLNLCHAYANCIYSLSSQSYVCSCRPGYTGTGLECTKEPTESCDIENNCHPEAACSLSESHQEYRCVCRHGFVGDGYSCMRSDEQRRYQDQQGNPEPSCLLAYCWCPEGFIYDTFRKACERDEEGLSNGIDCSDDPTLCHPNATCLWEHGLYACKCIAGYSGDGRQCFAQVQDTCLRDSECSEFGECTSINGHYGCRCKEFFQGDGRTCIPKPEAGCDVLRNCDTNGQCNWNPAQSKYICECNPGYRGDGVKCQEDLLGCNILKNCGRNANCLYDGNARGFRCKCKDGFIGDGNRCKSSIPCYTDPTVCDPNAQCIPNQETREWSCQCNTGFIGDGQECRTQPKLDGAFIIVAKGMSLIKVPISNGGSPFPLIVEPFQTAIGIATDCLIRKIFWGDVSGRSIKSASFNGTDKETFLSDDIGSPEGIVVDIGSGNLYWTDSLKDTIEVANIKSKLRRTLISDGLVNPRGIAVYEQRGRLFWSDWDRKNPKIEYSGLDGKDRQIFIKENLILPNALVIDMISDELCWADAGTHTIECVEIDGRNRRVIVKEAKYPFGLQMSSEKFFYTDWETKKLESASRFEGIPEKGIDINLGGTSKVYGIALVPLTCSLNYSPCEYSPCGDDRICVPNIRGGRSCLCPNSTPLNCTDIL